MKKAYDLNQYDFDIALNYVNMLRFSWKFL